MSTSLKLLLALCMILIVGYVYFIFQSTQSTPIQSTSQNSAILAVHLDPATPVSSQEIMAGHNGFLIYKSPDDPGTIYLLDSLSSLKNLDMNGDNTISPLDSSYKNLYYVQYQVPKKVFIYTDLMKAGIRGIVFSGDFLDKEKVNDLSRFSVPASIVILSDGSKRELVVVPMNTQDLNSIDFVQG